MSWGKDRRGRSTFAIFASAITFVISGACGRTPLLDGWQEPTPTRQGDAGDGKRDSGPDVGVAIGNNAIAVASCSPNDATAVSIHIGVDRPSCDSTSSGAYVVVALWYTSWDHLKPGSYALDAKDGWLGMSAYSPVPGTGDWEAGTNTILIIKSIDSSRMTGHCTSSFPSGTVSVDFTAQWCAGYPMCG